MFDWLDTETKAILEKVPSEKLAPTAVAGFSLVLLYCESESEKLPRAVMRIRGCDKTEAEAILVTPIPTTIKTVNRFKITAIIYRNINVMAGDFLPCSKLFKYFRGRCVRNYHFILTGLTKRDWSKACSSSFFI